MRTNPPTVAARAALRREIADHVHQFLARGGRIEVLNTSARQAVAPSRELWQNDVSEVLLDELRRQAPGH